MKSLSIFWFRRDLRLYDNHALYEALKSGNEVLGVYIFDKTLLKLVENSSDPRITFIYRTLEELQRQLVSMGSNLLVIYDDLRGAFEELNKRYDIKSVYANIEYEPYSLKRDRQISHYLKSKHIDFYLFKDEVIFEKDEILKSDGTPYLIFSSYERAWRRRLALNPSVNYPCENYLPAFVRMPATAMPSLHSIGFKESNILMSKPVINPNVIEHYEDTHNFPWMDGTTRLSVHIRYGTVSIRQLVHLGSMLNPKWLQGLIRREFYIMLLYHFPNLVTDCYKEKYEYMKWRNEVSEFQLWCNGHTGFPLVDAGMRQLNATGFMPERIRVIAASFLTKYLLIDWRWGEAYFASQLLDYDIASNVCNWQRICGCGIDSMPYYKFYKPNEQAQKYDSQGLYQQKWLDPNYGEVTKPMIDLKEAKKMAFKMYRQVNILQADDMD